LFVSGGHEIIKIEDSPHYKLLKGDERSYVYYLKKANQPDHSLNKFKSLIDNFTYNESNYLQCEKHDDIYVIKDGVHRASILKYRGITDIPIVIINV